MDAKSLQLCLTVYDPMKCSPPDSSIHGIHQKEHWNGLLCPPQGISQTQGLNLHLCFLQWQAGRFFTTDSAIQRLGMYPEKTIIERHGGRPKMAEE